MKKIIKFLKSNLSNFTSTKKVYFVFLILALIIYGRSLSNGFVWDDITAMTENPQMQHYDLINILGRNIYNDGSFYRPVSALYFFTLHLIFNNNAFFYHAIQLILHIIVTMLLFEVFKKFFKANLAFILSLMFLTHPINTEPVSFISGGQAIIYSIFGLGALYLTMQKELNLKKSRFIILLFALAILAKEEGLQYIIMANLYCLAFDKKRFKQIFFLSFLSGVTYLAVRQIFTHDNLSFSLFNQSQGFVAANPITVLRLSFIQKLYNIPPVIFYYLKTFIFPSKLAIDQVWAVTKLDPSVLIIPIIFTTLFFGALTLLGIDTFKHQRKNYPIYLFFLSWFLIGLGIHLPILKSFFNMTVADRWFYFTEVGLLGLIGVLYQHLSKRAPLNLILGASVLVIALLSVRSYTRSLNFHDNITLFEHDSRVYDNSLIEQNLGFYYLQIGNTPLAIAHSSKSVSLFPTEGAYLNLALGLEGANRLGEAGFYYKKAYETPHYSLPGNVVIEDTYFFYSRFLLRTGRPSEALKIAEAGIASWPDSDRLYVISGVCKYVQDDKNGALKDISEAMRMAPDNKDYPRIFDGILNNQKLENPI